MNKATNRFDFIENEVENTNAGKLVNSEMLIARSKEKASLIMTGLAKSDDKAELIELIKSGNGQDLIDLIMTFVDQDQVEEDAAMLANSSEEELSRMLESRRSDRSKKFKAGPLSSVTTCQAYIGAMYAELVIRQAWNKPYSQTTSSSLDESDLEQIGRKIKSLQSKKCRLKKTAQYVESDQVELEAVEAEIARLNSFRPSISTKTVVKSENAELVRQALSLLDQSTLDETTLGKLKAAGLL